MRRIFVDTSAWYDLALPGTPAHAAVASALKTPDAKFITSTYVVAELVPLIANRFGHARAARAASQIRAAAALAKVIRPSRSAIAIPVPAF